MQETLSFEAMPQAILELMHKVDTLGVDIYTVSKLLGHASLWHTQRYAKIVDRQKDDAVSLVENILFSQDRSATKGERKYLIHILKQSRKIERRKLDEQYSINRQYKKRGGFLPPPPD